MLKFRLCLGLCSHRTRPAHPAAVSNKGCICRVKHRCGWHATAKLYAPDRAHIVLLRHGLSGRPSPARPTGLRPPDGGHCLMRVLRDARLAPDRGQALHRSRLDVSIRDNPRRGWSLCGLSRILAPCGVTRGR